MIPAVEKKPKNVERISTSHSLEKSASLWVEGEFLPLYNKVKTRGKQKKDSFLYDGWYKWGKKS